MTMSEPIADGVPPLPPLAPVPERLDVESAPEHAVDLDARDASAAQQPPTGRHHRDESEPLTRAQRRTRSHGGAERASVLDHPAMLMALSVLTLVALVVGLDQASQGNPVALLPAAVLVVAYVAVVRRRVARR